MGTRVGWGALTPAELRIAPLLAEGRSNKEIAAQLHLSYHTVESHLRSMLVKLDAPSRAVVAVLADRHLGGSVCSDDASTIIDLEPGEVVVRQGEPGDELFIVLDGGLEVSIGGEVVNRLGPGSVFGERGALTGEPRRATVQALGHARCRRIAACSVDAYLARPGAARALLLCVLDQLAAAEPVLTSAAAS